MARFRHDPQGFLDGVRLPAILEEIQNVTESMAGRAAVLQLWPLSARESAKVGMLRGGYPEVLARPQATGQLLVVPPYFENLGKRLIKSPQIYIADSGLACHLLGIDSEAELEKSPFLGALFEGFIAAEIVKAQLNSGRRRELYTFRDQQGLEVDFVVPAKGGGLRLIEAKASRTAVPAMARPMERLAAAWRERSRARAIVEKMVVHRPPRSAVASSAPAPGVKAMPWREFVNRLRD